MHLCTKKKLKCTFKKGHILKYLYYRYAVNFNFGFIKKFYFGSKEKI